MADQGFGVDIEIRDQLVDANLIDDLFTKVLAKRIDFVRLDAQSCRRRVAAELDQVL